MADRVWDRALDFDKTKSAIGEALVKTRAEVASEIEGEVFPPLAPIRLSHYSVMAIQINNGARASEAVWAFGAWAKGGERELQVRVAKESPKCGTCHHTRSQGRSAASGHEVTGHGLRGRCLRPNCSCTLYVPDPKDVETRLIAIPPELLESDRMIVNPVLDKSYTLNAYKVFCRNHIAGNSHSLRYAYITMLHVKEKLSIGEIAKITHHHNINELVTYFQKSVAEATQRRIAGLPEKAGGAGL